MAAEVTQSKEEDLNEDVETSSNTVLQERSVDYEDQDGDQFSIDDENFPEDDADQIKAPATVETIIVDQTNDQENDFPSAAEMVNDNEEVSISTIPIIKTADDDDDDDDNPDTLVEDLSEFSMTLPKRRNRRMTPDSVNVNKKQFDESLREVKDKVSGMARRSKGSITGGESLKNNRKLSQSTQQRVVHGYTQDAVFSCPKMTSRFDQLRRVEASMRALKTDASKVTPSVNHKEVYLSHLNHMMPRALPKRKLISLPPSERHVVQRQSYRRDFNTFLKRGASERVEPMTHEVFPVVDIRLDQSRSMYKNFQNTVMRTASRTRDPVRPCKKDFWMHILPEVKMCKIMNCPLKRNNISAISNRLYKDVGWYSKCLKTIDYSRDYRDYRREPLTQYLPINHEQKAKLQRELERRLQVIRDEERIRENQRSAIDPRRYLDDVIQELAKRRELSKIKASEPYNL